MKHGHTRWPETPTESCLSVAPGLARVSSPCGTWRPERAPSTSRGGSLAAAGAGALVVYHIAPPAKRSAPSRRVPATPAPHMATPRRGQPGRWRATPRDLRLRSIAARTKFGPCRRPPCLSSSLVWMKNLGIRMHQESTPDNTPGYMSDETLNIQ
jgi:hypothetical protein